MHALNVTGGRIIWPGAVASRSGMFTTGCTCLQYTNVETCSHVVTILTHTLRTFVPYMFRPTNGLHRSLHRMGVCCDAMRRGA